MAKYWDVEVLTTCAIDYMTWQNEYPPGPTTVNGITVQRSPVRRAARRCRLQPTFRQRPGRGAGRDAELQWMKAQGPFSSALLDYLQQHHQTYDWFIFFTYLYASHLLRPPLVAGPEHPGAYGPR